MQQTGARSMGITGGPHTVGEIDIPIFNLWRRGNVTALPACKEREFMTIPIYEGEVPSLTTEQMIEVDRAMMQDLHIELIQMMENAGRNLAHLARVRFFDGNPGDEHLFVLPGTVGNTVGPLLCLRRLP